VSDRASAPDDQAEVIGFLSRPASYGPTAGAVERVETHCSIVFLVGDRAFKLKRAIRYANLDYTTLGSRQAACQAELRLNRRTAPELYLGMRSIGRAAGGQLAFDTPGTVLDHVVVMRRFAQGGLLDRMVAAGEATPALMRETGEAVARLHRIAEATPSFGGSDALRRVIADNDRELARVAAELDGAAVGLLGRRTHVVLDRMAELLDRRRAEGKVRRCHGDLRLANICLHDGRPTLFDCIEFSDEVSCIDVLYDLAFLLMDLALHGRADLGNVVFNAYLDCLPETEGLRALPLFLGLRAATRSYALAGGAQRQPDAAQAARQLAFARRHIDAGIGFLAPSPPWLIALGGEAASERRALAASLAGLPAPPPGARVLHLGRNDEAAWQEASGVLAAGCSVLIEGDFANEAMVKAATALAARHAVRMQGFWAGVPPPEGTGVIWQALDSSGETAASLARFRVDVDQCGDGRTGLH
jgi:uncharacterized protein